MNEHPEHRLRDRLESFEQAAIEAEMETGAREETVEEAKRHILVRIARVAAGFMVLIAGIIMLPLPGPGMLTIIAGLALLSSDIPFARRLMHRLRERLPSDEQGNVSRGVVVLSLTGTVLVTAFSLWWTLGR